MKKLFTLIIYILFMSCSSKEELFEYSYISDTVDLESIETRKVVYKASIIGDSLIIVNEDGLKNRFKYLKEKDGLYIIKDGIKKILYPFELETEVIRDTSLVSTFYSEVKLIRKRKYFINEKEFVVYHYIENGYDDTIDSYYLEGEGFVCFYKFADNEFLYLNSPKALELGEVFLRDTSFFAMLEMREVRKKYFKD